jgi:hypothetical protein
VEVATTKEKCPHETMGLCNGPHLEINEHDSTRTGHEEVTGDTPDISEYIDFDFYDWVWYWDTPDKENSPKMGRWLGPSHWSGAAMCYFVLVSNGEVILRTSVQHVTKLEMVQDEIKHKMEAYNNEVQGRLRDEGFECRHEMENAFYIDDEDLDKVEPEEPTEIDEAESFTPEAYDEYIGAQVMLPYQDGRIQGTITKRAKGNNGNPIGRRNNNIYLDTRRYMKSNCLMAQRKNTMPMSLLKIYSHRWIRKATSMCSCGKSATIRKTKRQSPSQMVG